MAKKIIIAVLALAAIAAGLFFAFREIEEETAPASSTLNAIPTSAALVFEAQDPAAVWSKLTQSNVMWEGLKTAPSFSALNATGHYLDSLTRHTPELQSLFDKKSTVLSIHMAGAGKFHFLAATALPNGTQRANVDGLMKKLAPGATIVDRQYDGSIITDVKLNTGVKFSYTTEQGLLVISPSPVLIEEAVRHLNSGSPLTDEPAFERVRQTAGVHDVDGNLYINYSEFPKVLGTYLNISTIKQALPLVDFAEWTEMDLLIRTNGVQLEGFTYASDSINNYLNLFANQETEERIFHQYAPLNTALLIEVSLSDPAAWTKEFRTHLERNNKLHQYDQKIEAIATECGCDPVEGLTSWHNGRMALLITEPAQIDPEPNAYALFGTEDAVEAQSKIEQLITTAAATKEITPEVQRHQGHIFKRIPLDEPLEKLFGNLFEPIRTPWYTMYDEQVIIANSAAALRDYLSLVSKGKTLASDQNYLNFTRDLGEESNLFLYSSIARSPNLYKSYLGDEYVAAVDSNLELFRQFEAVAFQLAHHKENLYLNQLHLKYNPVYKEVTSSLWEADLDTSSLHRQWLVRNHYTNTDEVLIEDHSNTINLFSTTGQLLWKRKLPEPIMGDVHQIDIFKNGKLQMLFNTASNVYLIDRNGENVSGWPTTLMAPATCGLSLMDYDVNKEYRILVPTADNKVTNFDKTGQIVTGWTFGGTSSPVRHPIQHFVVKNKDYILIAESNGTLHLVDRRGNVRAQTIATLDGPSLNKLVVEKGGTIESSHVIFTDTAGTIVKLTLDGNAERAGLETLQADHLFEIADVAQDKRPEYILAGGNVLRVYSADKTPLFEKAFDGKIGSLTVYSIKQGDGLIAITIPDKEEVWVLNNMGDALDGMPLFGGQKTVLGDMNQDGTLDLVTGTAAGKIISYTVRQGQ